MDNSNYLKSLSIIHVAILIGQLLFIGISLILKGENSFFNAFESSKSIYFITLFLCIVCLFFGNFIYKLRCNVLTDEHDFQFKLNHYKSAFIIKFICFEIASIFSTYIYFTTANYFYLLIAIILVFLTALDKPSKNKMLKDINWTSKEAAKIMRFD